MAVAHARSLPCPPRRGSPCRPPELCPRRHEGPPLCRERSRIPLAPCAGRTRAVRTGLTTTNGALPRRTRSRAPRTAGNRGARPRGSRVGPRCGTGAGDARLLRSRGSPRGPMVTAGRTPGVPGRVRITGGVHRGLHSFLPQRLFDALRLAMRPGSHLFRPLASLELLAPLRFLAARTSLRLMSLRPLAFLWSLPSLAFRTQAAADRLGIQALVAGLVQ